MATRTWRGTTDSNWGTSTNWLEGAVPLATDDVVFDATSPNCTVNTSNRVAKTLVTTGYTNTITMTFAITVSGTITLSATTVFSGAGILYAATTATLTSNTCVVPNFGTAGSAQTFTLGDDWQVVNYSHGAGTNLTMNGNTLNISGNLTRSAAGTFMTGTTNIVFNGTTGTSTWSGGGSVANNITINCSNAFVISGSVLYTTGTLTYTTAGSVTTTGSTLTVSSPATLNIAGMTLANFSVQTAGTITLSSAIVATNNLTSGSNASIVLNGYSITFGGNLTLPSQCTLSGTTNLIWNGSGGAGTAIWSGGGFNNTYGVRNNLTFNGSGTLQISGTVGYGTGTLTNTAGTISLISTPKLILGGTSCTLNTAGITWVDIDNYLSSTLTLTSALTATGTLLGYNNNTTQVYAGTGAWTVGTWRITGTGGTPNKQTLTSGLTYNITSFISKDLMTTLKTIDASTPSSPAYLVMGYGGTLDVGLISFTDISNSGRTIWDWNGDNVLLRTVGINLFTCPNPVSY